MSRKIILLLFFSIIFLTVYLHAENPKWLNYTYGKSINALEFEGKYLWIGHCGGLTKLNTEDGTMEYFTKANSSLPITNVTSISIDSSGVKWFGTNYGLTKFDGMNWEIFTTNNSPLRSNNIRALATDKKGNLWIGTDKEGLTKYDGKNWTFYDTTIRSTWSGIFTIVFDSLGNLYAANSDRNAYGAVNMLDTNYHWKNVVIADYVSSISVDKKGYLWFAFGSGYTNALYKWKDSITERYFFTTRFLPKGTIGGIDYDSKSNMWFTSYDRGLIKYDGSFNIHGKFIEYNYRYSPIPFLNGQCIKIDKDDNIWMGTNFNLWKFNGKDWISYNPQNSDFDYLKVTANYVDKFENIWISNNNSSFFIIDSTNWLYFKKLFPEFEFKNLIFDNQKNPWFYQNGNLYKYTGAEIELFDTLFKSQNVGNVNKIYYDNETNLMILSSQGTLLKYQNNTWIKYSDIYPTIPDKNINFIKIDSKNNFWIGSNQGLFILTKDGLIIYKTTNSKLPNDNIICIYVDSDSIFWIGTGDGLVHFDNNKWDITNRFTKNYDGEFFNIEQIIKDKNGIYWFKKHDRYYHGDDKFGPIYIDKYYLLKYKDTLWATDSINNESNFLMLSDNDSTILIILPSMGILSYENNTWTNITFDNSPLTDFSVNYIDIDSKNTYWISTDRGLSVYNKSGITDKIILNRKPEPPTGLTSIQDKFNFNIKWCASTTKNVFYRIYRRTKSEVSYQMIADNINDSQYLDVIPTDTIEFYYIVRAVSNDNNFESNNSIEISTHNIIPKIRYFNMGNTNIRSEQIYSISVDSNCTVWIGSWNGLCKNVSSTFTPLLCYPRIYKVCTNSDNSIWVLNDYDLLKFISKDSTNYKSMLHKQGINNFCFDERGRVIISINDSMLIFENDDWHQFFGLGTNNKKYKIIAAGINNKFIGLSDDGIVLNDGLNIKSFSLTDLNVKSLKNAIIDTKGNYWVLTNEGLLKYDGSIWINLGGTNYQMAFDKNENIWLFGTLNNKYTFTMYNGNEFKYYEIDSLPNGQCSNTSMAVDCNNNKWIGCYNGGLVVFNENGLDIDRINFVDETEKVETPQIMCYPNPMSNSTQFKFNIQDESNIRLSIFDIHGNIIKTIAEGIHQPGNYSLDWNGCDEQGNLLSNGMYFYQLDINGRKEVGKLMVVR